LKYFVIALLASLVSMLPAYTQWQSEYFHDHPLVGKIFHVEKGRWISFDSLTEIVQEHNIVLLGETHSNPDHHNLQAQVIASLIKAGESPAIVMEMLEYDQLVVDYSSDEAMLNASEILSPQWDWSIYQPIARVAYLNQLPLLGGNLDEETLKVIRRQKSCEFDLAGMTINICQSLPATAVVQIQQLIYESHCKYMPWEHTDGMAYAQIAKDIAFANKLMSVSENNSAVLIAGSVHVRKDIGVPIHLQQLGQTALSVGFINVHPDFQEISDYTALMPNESALDVLVFTPSDRHQDPCVEFAKQLEKIKQQ